MHADWRNSAGVRSGPLPSSRIGACEAGVHRPGLDRLLKHAKLKLIELVIVLEAGHL